MGEYFKNQYRINSLRLNHWDYSWSGKYYVTICSKNKVCCFGEIKDDRVYLSEIGEIVFSCWIKIPGHFENVFLDDWIIMPNHIHGIVTIKDNDFDKKSRDTTCHVFTKREFGYMTSKSLSSIIQAFKASVTRDCNNKIIDFKWQSGFYEHIIRHEDDFTRIKQYIANNPINWHNDRDNPLYK